MAKAISLAAKKGDLIGCEDKDTAFCLLHLEI